MTSLRHNTPESEVLREPRDGYLDAARDCLLDVGWRRTTLTEVARRAGVSRMTIYRTWADMPTLLADLMTREWSGLVQQVRAGLHVEADPLTMVRMDVVGLVRLLRQNELFVRIVELDPELILPYLFARRGRSQDAVLAILESTIRSGQQQRAVRQGDPTLLARTILLAAHGFVLSAQTMVDDRVSQADLDHELEQLVERVLAP
jgi:AcrR family transcriptional regulator